MAFATYNSNHHALGSVVAEWHDRYAGIIENFGTLGRHRVGDFEQQLHELPKARMDAVLHELLTLEHSGHEVAGRLLLQLMLPKVAHLARSCTGLHRLGFSTKERECAALSAMWEAIHEYPLRRVNSVAGNLALNALSIITTTYGSSRAQHSEVAAPDDFLDALLVTPGSESDEPTSGDSSFHDLVKVLTWAIDANVLTKSEVVLLSRYDLGEPAERTSLAEELSLSAATLSKRVWRIRSKLIEAVRTHISTFGRW